MSKRKRNKIPLRLCPHCENFTIRQYHDYEACEQKHSDTGKDEEK